MGRRGKLAFASFPDPAAEYSFLSIAERINEIFRAGAVAPDERACISAALLLNRALPESLPENPRALIRLLNRGLNVDGRANHRNAKTNLLKHLRVAVPDTAGGREKLAQVIREIEHELRPLRAGGILDSAEDRLGRFHEVFLKHAGWARDQGIVFTPPHLARFAARILNIGPGHRVYDPTCGTGGFLTAALEAVSREGRAPEEDAVFGLEQDARLAGLAAANMLLRERDAECIRRGDCLADELEQGDFTHVLMNPPFAVKGKPEFRFVERALESLRPGGLLFAVLPYSVLTRPGLYRSRRRNLLLRDNTLLAVITLPEELFHPVGVPAAAIVLRKGTNFPDAEPRENGVLWARVLNDGLRIRKGRRLPDARTPDELSKLSETLRAFIRDSSTPVSGKRRGLKIAPVDLNDPLLELVPESYLDDARPSAVELLKDADMVVRESLAAMVKAGKAEFDKRATQSRRAIAKTKWNTFSVSDLLDISPGDFHSLAGLQSGPWPVVSRAAADNGLAGYFEKPDGARVREPGTITVSTVTGDTFVQFMPYLATDNVLVCVPRETLPPGALYFIQLMINRYRWRYSYGRQCYLAKFRRVKISLPVTAKGELNTKWMTRMLASARYWPFAREVLERAAAVS